MEPDDIYLILHKVAGETSFDIATPMEIPDRDGVMWIIPTSGHRAYPAMKWRLKNLLHENLEQLLGQKLEGLPDHFPPPTAAAVTTVSRAVKYKPDSLKDFLT